MGHIVGRVRAATSGVRAATVAAALVAVATACTAHAERAWATDPMDPVRQTQNIALSSTRSLELTPGLLAQVAVDAAQRVARRASIHLLDPERAPDPNACYLATCVGDPRLEDWARTSGTVAPVLFTSRSGATLSGHLWATRQGPARRPGVVIDNGSIIGYEQAYWPEAQALAKAGFVVMTFDVQGEGDSDQLGAPPDQLEDKIAGAPPFGDGGGFYDGVQDALDFLLSTPSHPYVPRPSRTSGTSHASKQLRRVATGRNAGYDPYWQMLDGSRIGLAGHSFGAYAVSYVGQADPRVDAVVAWDALCVPINSTRTESDALGSPDANGATNIFGVPLPDTLTALPGDECMGAPPGYAPDVPVRVPALGISGDYVLAATPFVDRPERDFKARVSEAYNRGGVDSGQIVIRGGTHGEPAFAPLPLATLRGLDIVTWYTAAWFDRYLRNDPSADARLLSARWRDDARGRASDPAQDANMLSEFYRSRIDIHTTGGTHVACEDVRAGCAGLVPAGRDCGVTSFGYVEVDTAPDNAINPLRASCPSASGP